MSEIPSLSRFEGGAGGILCVCMYMSFYVQALGLNSKS